MKGVFNSLCLFLFLLAASSYSGQDEDEDFRIIYTDGVRVWEQRFDGSEKTELFVSENSFIEALAYHKDNLWLSERVINTNGKLKWRIKAKYSSRRKLSLRKNYIWKDAYHSIKSNKLNLVSLVSVDKSVLLGFNDGKIIMCSKPSIERFSGCNNLLSTGLKITGFDYNPIDNFVYVFSESDSMRCSVSKETNQCEKINPVRGKISTLRISFDAVWINVNENQLWKCPLDRIRGSGSWKFINNDNFCYLFDEYENKKAKIEHITASEEYLYISAGEVEHISRCKPAEPMSCEHALLKPNRMKQFIIVPRLMNVDE